MRSPLTTALLTIAILPFAGAPPASAQDTSPSARAAAVVAFALDQFKSLTPGVTLAQWRARHPDDSVTRFIPPEQEDQHRGWCARLDGASRLADGHSVRRVVWFYPTAPPAATGSLPLASATTLFGQCIAGLVELKFIGTDSASIASLDSAVNQTLTVRLGAPVKPPEYGNEQNWSGHARWATNGTSIIAGYYFYRGPQPPQQHGPILSVAAASIDREMHAQEFNFDVDGSPTGPPVQIDELFTLAQLDAELSQELRASLAAVQRHHDPDWRATPAESDRFVHALQQWLALTAKLPPPRRAAALLVADEMVAGSPKTGWGADSDFEAMAARFTALGAPIVQYPGGDGNSYSRSFLKEAIGLDTGTRAGDIAFILSARQGFTIEVCNDTGSDDFRLVIARGNDYLRRHPHSTITGELHFLIARAWGDIINLGSGGGFEVDSSDVVRYKAEMPAARMHAIAEYRTALAMLPDGPERKVAWTEGWRLAAGLAPIISHFYCTND